MKAKSRVLIGSQITARWTGCQYNIFDGSRLIGYFFDHPSSSDSTSVYISSVYLRKRNMLCTISSYTWWSCPVRDYQKVLDWIKRIIDEG
jgi:hypothetical protein